MPAASAQQDVDPGPGYDLILDSGNGYINGALGVGTGNLFSSMASSGFHNLAVGSGNTFDDLTLGLVIGYDNILNHGAWDGSYATLITGQQNSVFSSYSLIAGSNNEIVGSSYGITDGLLVGGAWNQVEDHKWGLVSGYGNTLEKGSAYSMGVYSAAIGSSNTISTGMAWTMGSTNNVTGLISTSLGWGLLNHAHSAVMIGTFNQNVAVNADAYAENNPSFVLGNGSSTTVRSNAIVTLKNGETTLANKAWDPEEPLVAPTTANMSSGRALVVDGHAVFNGQVIIAEPQGDISMGIYGN